MSHYALQTPSGNIFGVGTEKPKLSKQDKRNFWRVLRLPLKQEKKPMVDNQHKQIKGYRDLTPEEIASMNECKAKAVEVGALCEKIRVLPGVDLRWVSIGTTDLQKGFMALIRGIAKPETF